MPDDLEERYRCDGFVAPIRVVDDATARWHRERFERAEREIGPMHYRDKAYTILRSPLELVTIPALLDAVEACIGPDILVYNAVYIVKEPGSGARVAWHQDLTYWGLSDDDAQVSAWIALAPATVESGCMRMVPGSHRRGRVAHITPPVRGPDDVLDLGQYIEGIDEGDAVHVPLEPGEASLHHGWTVHASTPNRSSDRRIGLNIQYLAPRASQTVHDGDTALLVRGVDEYDHFGADVPAAVDLDPAALALQRDHQARIKGTYATVRDS